MGDPIIKPDRIELPGAEGGRLFAQWTSDGVKISVSSGRVLITDQNHAQLLAAFITREDESA